MILENQLLTNYHSYDLVYPFWIKSGRFCQVCREPTFITIFEHPPVKTLKNLPVWLNPKSQWYLLSFQFSIKVSLMSLIITGMKHIALDLYVLVQL